MHVWFIIRILWKYGFKKKRKWISDMCINLKFRLLVTNYNIWKERTRGINEKTQIPSRTRLNYKTIKNKHKQNERFRNEEKNKLPWNGIIGSQLFISRTKTFHLYWEKKNKTKLIQSKMAKLNYMIEMIRYEKTKIV